MVTINNKQYCENCFTETTVEPCPHCGFSKTEYRHDPTTLPIGSVLSQRYMIGGVIGKGGFGITYLAYDLKLDARLAVKEYYPMGLAVRNPNSRIVTVSNSESEDSFNTGAEKFYNEAKMVAKFDGNPNIVSVHDFFYENETVYFTMGYLQGQTLKSYLKKKTVTEGQAVNIFNAISGALMASHGLNILHRDISPDNIMLCDDGSIRLLDFGAARQVMAEQSQSLSVILKQGFAPLEQYQKKGKQGPWTDIYALGATIYAALTGDMLSDPMSRLEDDSEFESNKHGISEPLWNIIKKCTQLKIQDRYQSVPELKEDLASVGIESEKFDDIKEEITDILRKHLSKPFGSTISANMVPNYAPASDPNATMLLDAASSQNMTMSMAQMTGQPVTGQPVTGQPVTGQPAQQFTGTIPQPVQQAQQTPGQQPQSSGSKFPIWLIAVIAVIALAVFGFVGYKIIGSMMNKDKDTTISDNTDDDTDNGDDKSGSGDKDDDKDSKDSGTGEKAGEEADMLRSVGADSVEKYVNSDYMYSICYPSGYSVSEVDESTVEIANEEGSLHVAVRYKDRYIDDSILYDAQDFANMINVRRDNLLPVEGSGSTPETDNAGRVEIAEQEDISHFEYHYTDKKKKSWGGNVYLFDSKGQYGCYIVYTLVYGKADDYDELQEYAKACADSFRVDGEYEPPEVDIYRFDDYGIKFSVTNGVEAKKSSGDSAEGTIHVKYKNKSGKKKQAFVIPGEHFGTEFADILSGATDCLSGYTINIVSDMTPLDFGEYKGYWVKMKTVSDEDGEETDGLIYIFSTNYGSDAEYQTYMVMGESADKDRLKDIVGGFRFDGATTYDNAGVDTSETVSLSEGSSGDDDIDEFLENYSSEIDTSDYIFPGTDKKEVTASDVDDFLKGYLKSNNAKGMSDSQKKNLCARALCYARNEIYARHGYIFNSGELRELFGNMSWYKPTTPSDKFNSNVFNTAEKRNIEFLKSKMEDYGGYQPAK